MVRRSAIRGGLVALVLAVLMVGAAPGQAGDKEPEVCPVTTVEIIDALGPSEWKGTLTLDPSEGCVGVLTFVGTIDGKSFTISEQGALRLNSSYLIPNCVRQASSSPGHTVEFYGIDPATGKRVVERFQISVVKETDDPECKE